MKSNILVATMRTGLQLKTIQQLLRIKPQTANWRWQSVCVERCHAQNFQLTSREGIRNALTDSKSSFYVTICEVF